jgi:uncharacterized RDD family membrane protein YckC
MARGYRRRRLFNDRIDLTTPDRVVVGYEIAGVGTRMLAQVIDGLILGAVEWGLLIAFGATGAAGGLTGGVGLAVLIVTVVAVPFLYFVVMEARTGQTVGKRCLSCRVVTDDGVPIGWRESIVRNLIRPIDFLPSLYLLGGTVAVFSDKAKRLGDHAAGTLAVRVAPEGEPGRQPAQPATFQEAAAVLPAGNGIPPDLIALMEEYRVRHAGLTGEARRELAQRLSEHIERYHPKPDGMNDDEFVVRAAVTYGHSAGR